ncbi:signal transduction protein [Azospirillum sp. TSH100]|uniref:tricarballylate utilization 4Fe-4S protein TcuB n=1 Tax=Azospirillum sp. TSH100 TaxID=652764 RepID=UPI000D614966|nr:tricarballylate utilization 4Fe-4S protein TcuB [Azospirillum sp. TSH100]PWC88370.1 signal transduction protein [Azospirillum sp. TSH100]QCG90582.1 tricarballylate utilization 4Fe-4S protein TcuB [Azospirillum sp. TSH100]
MPGADETQRIAADARRALDICNACQFCGGYCAVFRALKARRQVSAADLAFLSNLCHNCRSCYHACQYAPPHAFDLNLPKSLSLVRQQTYRDHVWPPWFRGRLPCAGWPAVAVMVAIALSALMLVGLPALILIPPDLLFGRHLGPGAFYRLVPWEAIAGGAGALTLWSLLAVGFSVASFWHSMGPMPAGAALLPALRDALYDAASLRNLGGGGAGCNDRDERFSRSRRRFHHALFYGVVLCFAATAVATVYDHALAWQAPYPVLSLPVLLGGLGGTGILVGTMGLARLKLRADPGPLAPSLTASDCALLALLFLVAVSGLGLLALRETAAMGPLLLVHLGLVLGWFATLPYSKFLHAPFRFAALLRAAMERRHRAPQVGRGQGKSGRGSSGA